jgi:cysteine-rich repeat protein
VTGCAAMRKTSRIVCAAVLLLALFPYVSGPVQGATDPADVCASKKLKDSGKAALRKTTCHAKAVKRDEAVDPGCLLKADDKFSHAFVRAESKGGCSVDGDFPTAAAYVDQTVDDLVVALPGGVNADARVCSSSKRRAAAKNAKSELGCSAKAARKLELPDAACLAKSGDEMTSKFVKAESRGGCATIGDDASIALQVDALGGVLGALLAPKCGDGVASAGEQCDGLDDDACPGVCLSSCVCPGDCGNGIAEQGEECDDGGNVSGDGCAEDCTLEDTSAVCAGVSSTIATSLTKELVGNFSSPVHLTSPPLDPSRLFVVEQPGRIQVVKDGAVLPTPFLDIASLVDFGGERGLFSMAFHPDYESNGRFFVNYSDNSGDTVIARYEVGANPDVANVSSGVTLLLVNQPYGNHNGGQIAFGPDGYLYVGMGDGGGGGDPMESGQDDGQVLGKILRLDVDVESPPYHAVPPTNPAPGLGTPLGLVWSKGWRNPWRFSFDRANGDMYVADVGQNEIEEVSYEPALSPGGLNYGWDIFEGAECFEPDPAPDCPNSPPGFEFPVYEFAHPAGCSITGGHVYRGCAMPLLHGIYFFSDYCTSFVHTFEISGGIMTNFIDRSSELGAGLSSVSSFGEDARGELYILNLGGSVWRVVPD